MFAGGNPGLQEILILPEKLLGQLIFDLQPVLNTVHPLFGGQVKQVVDRNAEGFRQKRKKRNIRHRNSVLPFGYCLGTDAEFFRQLFLGQSRPETELSDFCSEFHNFLLNLSVYLQLHPDCKPECGRIQ